MSSDLHRLRRRLVRFNAVTFAGVFGLLAGGSLLVATVVLILNGGENPGATLSLLGQYLPGYGITWSGAWVGFAWAFLLGALLAFGPAWIYYGGVLRKIDRAGAGPRGERPLEGTVVVHVPTFAACCALFASTVLLLATLILLAKHQPGDPLGPHLELLRHYLPGYEVSVPGALLGAAGVFLLAGVMAALAGWIYNRIVRPSRPGPSSRRGE